MVVKHNLKAMNANRMFNVTQKDLTSSTEKLSSGYAINRAADNAAGLSISEKMRKQIRGLTQASSNAEDGISAVQTAEGALQEVHDMLQRMNELAVQASNGTNSESDRSSIQDEITQLTTEIDRVAETTKFNETYLLKGNGNKSTKIVAAHDAGLAGKLEDNGKVAKFTLESELKDGEKITIAGTEYTIGTGAGKAVDASNYAKRGDLVVTSASVSSGDSITDASTGVTYTIVDKAGLDDIKKGGTGVGALELKADKSTFTITHEDGSTSDYKVTTTTDGTAGTISENDAYSLIQKELEAGSKVTMTADKLGKACDVEIVKQLVTSGSDQEISSYNTNLVLADGTKQSTVAKLITASSMTVAEGDSINVKGKDTTFTTEKPINAADIAAVISKLDDGAIVSIKRDNGSGTKQGPFNYTIGSKTDVINNTYTVADLANMIQQGDDVAIGTSMTDYDAINLAASKGITIDIPAIATDPIPTSTNFHTAIGNVESPDSSTITKAEALEKIKDELAQASSIGTDEDHAATVINNKDGSFIINKGSVEIKDKLSVALHVGADADMTNKITVDLDTMSTAGLGIKNINVKDDIGSAATYAIDAIEDAIKAVSKQRSALGAVQNRLEHTIKNLDNVVENTTAAESQIRDTDMATEMVKFSNNNILAQAGQSMLAQANQSNQGVLSLLG